MPRPRSIAIFETAYLAALAINVAAPFLIWSTLTATVAEQAHVGAAAAGKVSGILVGGILVVAALGLLLWWLVARRRSNVARWIAIALLAYSLVSSALGLAGIGGAFDLVRLLSLLGMVGEVVALVTLFMPDARAWFAADEPEALA